MNYVNSVAKQTRVKNYESQPRVKPFIANGMEKSAALAQIDKSIIKLSRQALRSRERDAHKVEMLRSAVVGMTWSNEPPSGGPTQNLTLQQVYLELEGALQLDNPRRKGPIGTESYF